MKYIAVILLCFLMAGCGSKPPEQGADPATSAAGESGAPNEAPGSEDLEPVSTPYESYNEDVISSDSENESEGEMFVIDEYVNAAFSNEQGTKLISVYAPEESMIERYIYAFGENGELVSVRFNSYQKENENNTYRDVASNFGNREGYIYDIVNATVKPDATFLLVTPEFLDICEVINTPPSEAPSESEIISTRYMMEDYQKRSVEKIWELFSYNDMKCYFVKYENKDTDLLASLAIIDGNEPVVYDYPASLSFNSGWRVDDGGDIPDGAIKLLALVKTQDSYLVFFEWFGAEGNILYKLEYKDGLFIGETTVGSRYTSLN